MLDGTSYQVVRELGAGGMGVVYEIEHVRLKKRYVAKVIHEQIKNEDGAARRMEREAQVLAAISHPNIVQVHDVGMTQDGTSYFVMEKLEGVDLRSLMKRGAPRIRAIGIVADVLDALEYVHRRGIVHRDIKPENVFLSEQATGTVTKVLDFGIVHIFDSDGRVSQSRITKTGGFVGTLYYAAPEQMQGKAAGPPNDVYAAGLVLFELLAGKGPFDDDPGVGLSRCFKPAPLLSEFVPRAPQPLTQALARALEQDPGRRPAAGALASELRAIAAALKNAPGAADEEAIRAEVHDLLRHMPLADDVSPARPAAGRPPTGSDPAHPAAPLAQGSALAAPLTAAPLTPLMAGAPGQSPSDVFASFGPTLASPTGDPPPGAAAPLGVRPAAGAPAASAPVAATHPPTMPGVGMAPLRDSSPDVPAQAPSAGAISLGASSSLVGDHAGAHPAHPSGMMPMLTGPAPLAHGHRGSSPEAVATPNGHVAQAHAASFAPAFPSPYEQANAPNGDAPHVRISQPGQVPPLFASTLPVHGVHRHDSTPNAPARAGDNTSPGLYATVDNQPLSTPLPKRAPWTAIAVAGGAAVLLLVLVGGAFALRHKGASATVTAASTADPSSRATAAALVVEEASTSAPAAPVASSAAPVASPASTPPTAKPSTAPVPAGHAPQATMRATPMSAPAPQTKPAPPAPQRNGNGAQGAERDGYVKSL